MSNTTTDISHFDTCLDPPSDDSSKSTHTFALQSTHSQAALFSDSYHSLKKINTFQKSPNIIVLMGEYSCDCILLAYNLYLKLFDTSSFEKCLELHENSSWSQLDHSLFNSIIISYYSNSYDKLLAISDVLLNPGSIQLVFIISATLSTQLLTTVEFFPHWVFLIPPFMSTDMESLFLNHLYSIISSNPMGSKDFCYPIYSFHSANWLKFKNLH